MCICPGSEPGRPGEVSGTWNTVAFRKQSDMARVGKDTAHAHSEPQHPQQPTSPEGPLL